MCNATGDTRVFITPDFHPIANKTLRAQARQSGNCDACTRGYHAGEYVAIDHEVRTLHWNCHIREVRNGGRLPDHPRSES